MWRALVAAATMAVISAPLCLAQTAPDIKAHITACSQDTGPADCPATYQAVRASDCLGVNGNRACLIRMAREAAANNDCGRAYQLVYACQCNAWQTPARDAIKAAGPDAVCKHLRGG